jgi:predicted TPR repeat methyltransferase
MVVAFDTFPYLGALEPVFDAAARALKAGGWFAFSTEAGETGDYVLHGNGRYAHAPAYIARLAAGRFEVTAQTTARLRREAGRMLDGGYFLLRAL